MVKSIGYNEEEIIQNILDLHTINGSIDLDPTYSKGNFYRGKISQPIFKYDLYPQVDGVVKADCRNLPLSDHSIYTIMFDPPFLATTGKSLQLDDDNNKINKRFGVYPNEKALHQFYIDSLKEFHRILINDGVLIFKCQDKVSSGTQYMSHYFIMREAERIGFYIKDLFILLAKNRIVADWQLKNQKHARKFHSYFLVLQKSNKKVKYL